MADPTIVQRKLLSSASPEMRRSIVSGMRWTLWLSILSVPFSYATNVILARTGTEVIGTYGLLTLYVVLVSTVFYLGGDAVPIRFLPEIESKSRLSFLLSYLLITSLAALVWIAVASVWPQGLGYLFGRSSSAALQITLVCLAPLYIIYSVVNATLKAQMEIGRAQWLTRTFTFGSFAIYSFLFFVYRTWFRAHYSVLIWIVYFGLLLLATLWGVRLLRKSDLLRQQEWPPRFCLPKGFWGFTLALEGTSVLGAVQRLDYVMILRWGGLAQLGRYVAVMAFASAIGRVVLFFVDPLMPTVTNLVACREWAGVADTLTTYLRVLSWAGFGIASAMLLLAQPLVSILGPQYEGLGQLLIVMATFAGLGVLGVYLSRLLTSFGLQYHSLWISGMQIGLFVPLFFLLWKPFNLIGAALAIAIAQFVALVLQLWVVYYAIPVRFLRFRDYGAYIGSLFGCALIAHFLLRAPSIALASALVLANALYLLVAGYSLDECRRLVFCFVPLARRRGGSTTD